MLAAIAAVLLCAAAPARAQEGAAGRDVRQPALNVRPFEEVALRGKQLIEEGKLGRELSLDVNATAELSEDGVLRPETLKVVWTLPADETVRGLAHQLLSAVGESRLFGALEGAKSVRLGLKLDRRSVNVLAAAELASAEEAKRYAEGYEMLRYLGAAAKRGTDEGALYGWLRFASEGKMFKMTFEGPRDEVARVLAHALEKSAAKRAAQ